LRPDPGVKTRARTLLRFENNERLTDLYFIWLHLFPTPGPNNAKWEKLFKAKYGNNFKLRVSSKGSVNRFIMFAKKFDIGIYILGTFLFIKDHIREDGECYIPKIDNYFKVDEEWYDTALELVDEAETYNDILHIFTPRVGKSSASSTHGATII
jgi:hypothetical protein